MIEGILEQVRTFITAALSGALAPFSAAFDFITQLGPMWVLVLAILVASMLAGWFFGAVVRWFMGWVVTVVLAVAAGRTWQWKKDRDHKTPAKPRPKPAPPPPTSWWQ